ncbi:(2Fe-2S)-binding protein [Candidatus Poribacteria bacterium]|jgi:aerobic-type carbon monoxide dehydrogenase small subunit (CoxS/CutS family)|nr:(2Fe-2S)-binding protein [Candidatus Poribacteria bacterium]MBT5536231.1 (2Fe-2S)-binding protein [Candidatus Poribacteria bacterium]MBT5712853.1 (2Fe-2S)-binding protein [Candidatus Poribacteria bacterium]MBT7101025.1 (2Fe-2S)-binding protein [Candidatus Poribacteria bacterium]MBT7806745.1 (2Fe-2S)-binding protein [Candidatus Poribacteria bacterium]
MPALIELVVNGRKEAIPTEADRPLLDVLREDLGLTGPKYGCGEGACRACTVLVDGRSTISCMTRVDAVVGKEITTIEGLADGATLNGVQQAFVDEQAMQCGYCTPGMILTATALLERNPDPSHAEIVLAMNGNICRCGGYPKIIDAIHRAARGGEA